MEELSLHVVGVQYPNPKNRGNRRFEVEISHPGEPVTLVLEPKNPADPNAVAVFSCRNVQMGYLTAERAPLIGSIIRAGREVTAIFQEVTTHGAAIRVAFDGREPTLPPPSERRQKLLPPFGATEGVDPDPDFYPDEIPPDDF